MTEEQHLTTAADGSIEYLYAIGRGSTVDLRLQIERSKRHFPGLVFNYPPMAVWEPCRETPWSPEELWPPLGGEPLNLYIHIPFCRQKCSYCYYSVQPRPAPAAVEGYLSHLVREAARYAAAAPGRASIDTVFIGGGTPSYLDPGQIELLFNEVLGKFDLDRCREITFECAPESVTREKLTLLKGLGVNRVSIGVQSFDRRILERTRRNTDPGTILEAYQSIVQTGFPNINIDLIAGVEDEDAPQLDHTMDTLAALASPPQQVTLFTLSVRRGAQSYAAFRGRDLSQLNLKNLRLYNRARARLEKLGYRQYSRNLFCRSGSQFLYQDNIWRDNRCLLGLGASAYSHAPSFVYQNECAIPAYLRAIDRGILPLQRFHFLSREESRRRHLVLAMKYRQLEQGRFAARYAPEADGLNDFSSLFQALVECGVMLETPEGFAYTSEGLAEADRYARLFYSESVNRALLGVRLRPEPNGDAFNFVG